MAKQDFLGRTVASAEAKRARLAGRLLSNLSSVESHDLSVLP